MHRCIQANISSSIHQVVNTYTLISIHPSIHRGGSKINSYMRPSPSIHFRLSISDYPSPPPHLHLSIFTYPYPPIHLRISISIYPSPPIHLHLSISIHATPPIHIHSSLHFALAILVSIHSSIRPNQPAIFQNHPSNRPVIVISVADAALPVAWIPTQTSDYALTSGHLRQSNKL